MPTRRPSAAEIVILGDADDQTAFPLQVALKMNNVDEFHARLGRGEEISDGDLEQRYLPTAADYQAVLNWLTASGLTVTATYDNRVTVEARRNGGCRSRGAADSAPARDCGRRRICRDRRRAGRPGRHRRRHRGYQRPAALSSSRQADPVQAERRRRTTQAASIRTPSSPATTFRAASSTVYQALPFLAENGKGTTTAILIDTFPNATDVSDFWALTGVPQSLSDITFIQTVAGGLPPPSGEETLDTEWASSIGYGSKVRVYATKDLSFPHLDTGYQRILSDLKKGVAIEQLSVSLGGCEVFAPLVEVATENNLLSLIAAKNVSIFIASGDSGSRECGASNPPFPSWASTSPFVTAVGGTHLIAKVVSRTHLTIQSETGWTGSGGGFSNLFFAPSYQASLGAPTRVVPDVAAVADPATGVVIVLNGRQETIGGTSAATPIWAGFASLINQARIAAGKKPLGQFNPHIYRLLGSTDFHDDIGGCNGDYCAVKGYDLVTGIGSPVMNKLLPALVAVP